MDPATKELIHWVRNFLEFEGELAIGPDCPDPDGHERLTGELIDMINEMEASERISEDSSKAHEILEKAMRKEVA